MTDEGFDHLSNEYRFKQKNESRATEQCLKIDGIDISDPILRFSDAASKIPH